MFDAGGYERVRAADARTEAEAEGRAMRASLWRLGLALVVLGAVVLLRLTYVFC